MAHILAELAGAVGTVTFDHQHRRNALSHALVEELIAALQRFREGKARVVILRARPGAKVFSAGHDVDELPEARRDPLGWDDPLRRLVREIEGFPGPVIAMVEGSVWGGALPRQGVAVARRGRLLGRGVVERRPMLEQPRALPQ